MLAARYSGVRFPASDWKVRAESEQGLGPRKVLTPALADGTHSLNPSKEAPKRAGCEYGPARSREPGSASDAYRRLALLD